jgi:hypothetical protein
MIPGRHTVFSFTASDPDSARAKLRTFLLCSERFPDNTVMWGTCGVPISAGDLRLVVGVVDESSDGRSRVSIPANVDEIAMGLPPELVENLAACEGMDLGQLGAQLQDVLGFSDRIILNAYELMDEEGAFTARVLDVIPAAVRLRTSADSSASTTDDGQ